MQRPFHGTPSTPRFSALESQIATAASIAITDPGAAVAADMLGWLSHGVVVPSVHDFQTLRIIILTLMPAFAGPLLGLSLLGEGMTVKSIELLTALEVENAKPKDGKPIMLNDGRGLYLQVTPSKIVGRGIG